MAGGNWRQKVNQGDKLNVPAFWFNDVTDTMLAHKRGQQTLRGKGITMPKPEGLVWVQNTSGATVNQFGVLGLSGVLFNDTQNLTEFQSNWTLTGVTPTAAHVGKFAVTWEPIAAGAIGRAFIADTCPAQVKMNSTSDPFADVLPGDATQLQSGGTGAAQILFCGQPISSGSSAYWCIIRFGAPAASPILWGAVASLWTPGTNAVTLTPNSSPFYSAAISGASNVTAYIQYPLASPAVSLGAAVNDILAYTAIGSYATTMGGSASVIYKLVDPPLMPRPTGQYQVVSNAGSSGSPQWIADWVRAHS